MDNDPLRFIIKHAGKYYLTHELWEFDPALLAPDANGQPVDPPGLETEQVKSLRNVVNYYENGIFAHGAALVSEVDATASTAIHKVTPPVIFT